MLFKRLSYFYRFYSKEINFTKDCPFYKTPLKLKYERMPVPIYGGKRIITLIPGRGIGPEMLDHVKDIFNTAKVPIDYEIIDEDDPIEIATNAILSIQRNLVAIKGNIAGIVPIAPNTYLRTKLDLFVYLIHYKSFPSVTFKHSDVDIVLIRQNTEGEYAMLEHETVAGVIESLRIVTEENTKRLAHWALQYAKEYRRKKITVVHNIHLMYLSDSLFLETILEASRDYPQIEIEDMNIKNCIRQLIKNPNHFDILLTSNLFGSLLSAIICGLLGGTGMYGGKNYGEKYAVFEPATRHTGEDLVGKNIANPVAMLTCAVDLLDHIDLKSYANLIDEAITETIIRKSIRTPDIGGNNTTSDVINSIKECIKNNALKHLHSF